MEHVGFARHLMRTLREVAPGSIFPGLLLGDGIRVQAIEAHSAVRDRLRQQGLDAKLGTVNRFTSVADAVEAFQESRTTEPKS
jgi:hypothetical protein